MPKTKTEQTIITVAIVVGVLAAVPVFSLLIDMAVKEMYATTSKSMPRESAAAREARECLNQFGVEFRQLSTDVGYISNVELAVWNARNRPRLPANRGVAGSLRDKSGKIKTFAVLINSVTFGHETQEHIVGCVVDGEDVRGRKD